MSSKRQVPADSDVDFVVRATCDNKRMIARTDPLVVRRDSCVTDFLGSASTNLPPAASGTRGMGFAEHSVACDVVLPFHGQLEFVRQAVESILEQEGADVVLHLIDDGSLENTEDFLRFWGTHARVRTYRNAMNLGQYTSFNNVVRFCETGLIGVQDGDDVSHPRRLFRAGNHLRLSGAEISGGSLVEFEGPHVPKEQLQASVATANSGRGEKSSYLRSQYPVWDGSIEHFLFNGSCVMHSAVFKELGGFSDYGSVLRNRCNLDTEFYARAFFAGRTFAVTREIVSWCRRHSASATRNCLTGWGTAVRTANVEETRRRVVSWRRASCIAKQFGAMGRYDSLTCPWPDSRLISGRVPRVVAATPVEDW